LLPPRPLPAAPEAAVAEALEIVAGFAPFDIELGAIEKFDVTDVVYIGVQGGAAQLREMHGSLNRGVLAFPEPFVYHPHVTLAQNIEPGQAEALRELAARRWREFPGPRRFRAANAVFVRNTHRNLWTDLANASLCAERVT
jgi:2'-5' RNA ligase